MIKIEKTDVFGFKGALRGMRNPMNSWDKSDSGLCRYGLENPYCYTGCHLMVGEDVCATHCFVIGENDLELAKKLINAGSDHRKFLRMIHVQADVLAPIYFWKQFEQYKVATTTNSTSTMHKIHAKEFTLEDFSHEYLIDDSYDTYCETSINTTVWDLNKARELYLKTKDKKYWYQMIQLLPSSYNQLRTIDLNYEVLLKIYFARKNHKLDEWHKFCEWIEKLPYMEDFLNA